LNHSTRLSKILLQDLIHRYVDILGLIICVFQFAYYLAQLVREHVLIDYRLEQPEKHHEDHRYYETEKHHEDYRLEQPEKHHEDYRLEQPEKHNEDHHYYETVNLFYDYRELMFFFDDLMDFDKIAIFCNYYLLLCLCYVCC
jgi:hypothetical protein